MDDLKYLHDTYEDGPLKSEDFALNPRIYVVEDDRMLGLSIKKYLTKNIECNVKYFTNSIDCLNDILNEPEKKPFCLITDISLEHGGDGLLLIDNLKDKGFDFVSIVMTGFASIETAIAATKKGVFHYLTKPFELENLKSLVIQAISNKLGIKISSSDDGSALDALRKSPVNNQKYRLEVPNEDDFFCGIIGRSQSMKDVFDRIQKVALTESTVLITGASGTGKELAANAIHRLSSRARNNKVSVNCGAIPSELLESELFGHIKGSFTGAISDRKGRFELANSGSIFLDEIGDMPLLLQVKLLRVLQNRLIEPVGSGEARRIDVRVIAATHRDLEKAVMEGRFREDLFYRLNVIPVRIPSLKERKEDIPLLISYFIDRYSSADKSNVITFSDDALEYLLTYDWPGNVRELENIVERLVILRGGNEIVPEDLPAKIFRHNPLATDQYKHIFELPEEGVDLKKVLSEIEDSLILQALDHTRGNKNQASKLLCLNRTTLIEKMKKKAITL
jgi:two-component system response regulator PilR (NtrC family)